MTQEFFAQLLRRESIATVKGDGKFRSFLLAALKHHLASGRRDAARQKRAANQKAISFDAMAAEERYRLEPAVPAAAEKLFDRRWAFTLLAQTLARLRAECEAAGKGKLFELLEGHLTTDGTTAPHAEVAASLLMSESAVKVALHRPRHRYGEILKDEILQTLDDPNEVETELAALMGSLSD